MLLRCFKFNLFQRLSLESRKMASSAAKGIQGIGNEDKKSDRLIWIDLEMTGLNPNEDSIMEVACIITEGNLDIVAEAPTLVIHQPEDVLSRMDDWCLTHHKKTGLYDESLKSKLSIQEADKIMYDFVNKYTPQGKCCIAGNSVYMDRWFIKNEMPKLDNHLHYRLIDVTTLKELSKRWVPDEFVKRPPKNSVHRALRDIRESIDELRFYKATFFK